MLSRSVLTVDEVAGAIVLTTILGWAIYSLVRMGRNDRRATSIPFSWQHMWQTGAVLGVFVAIVLAISQAQQTAMPMSLGQRAEWSGIALLTGLWLLATFITGAVLAAVAHWLMRAARRSGRTNRPYVWCGLLATAVVVCFWIGAGDFSDGPPLMEYAQWRVAGWTALAGTAVLAWSIQRRSPR